MSRDVEHAILRRLAPADLPACLDIFYESVDPLYRALDQPLPPRDPASLARLIGHFLEHDGDRSWVAEAPSATGDPEPPRVLGFGCAWERETAWYLGLLFVRPEVQAGGIGRRLLLRTFPAFDEGAALPAVEARGSSRPGGTGGDPAAGEGPASGNGQRPGLMGTCVDSVQPISTGLYASYGIVPRVPLFTAIGRPRPGALPGLPRDVVATGFEALPGDYPLADAIATLDRATLGFARPADHRYWAREGRRGVLFRRTGSGDALGYGYAQPSGRLGPVALLDETLYPAVLGVLVARESPPGPFMAIVPGTNHRALVALLRAGLRFEGFPGIVASTRPWPGLDRYLVASFALL